MSDYDSLPNESYDSLPDETPVAKGRAGRSGVINSGADTGTSLGESIYRGAVQGSTLGWGAKASALGRAGIVNPVEDTLHYFGIGPGSTGQTYEEMRDEENAKNDAALQAHPVGYLGGAMVGGTPAALATGGKVLPMMAQGAVQGAGQTANDAVDMGKNMLTGAGVSGAFGVAGKTVGGLVGKASDEVLKAAKKQFPNMSFDQLKSLFSTPPIISQRTGQPMPSLGTQLIKNSISEGVQNLKDAAYSTIAPALGSVTGGYLGSVAAPAVGIDPKTGAEAGFLAGGGVGLGAAKHNMVRSAAAGVADLAGTAVLAKPNLVKNTISTLANAPSNVITLNTHAPLPTSDYDNLPNESRLGRIAQRLQSSSWVEPDLPGP